jgi:hypothetical protein
MPVVAAVKDRAERIDQGVTSLEAANERGGQLLEQFGAIGLELLPDLVRVRGVSGTGGVDDDRCERGEQKSNRDEASQWLHMDR